MFCSITSQGKNLFPYTMLNELNKIDDDTSNVQVSINNVMYKVSKDTPIETSLNVFIREFANLKGTKSMCHEGGCGLCIVAAEINGKIVAINSCLIPIYICDGWKITTIEGVGNRKTGYHTLQMALAEMNGSQCGYCSPAWVMTMYSLMQNGKLTMKEVENSFSGNLCRCTGYRPILDTFKSFATDAPPVMQQKIKDIEELYKIKSCKNCPRKTCNGTCLDMEIIYKSNIPRSLELNLNNNTKFFKVLTVNDIFEIFQKHPQASYLLHGGNTAHGVYRQTKVDLYIDINDVPDLQRIGKVKDHLVIGASATLSMVLIAFQNHMNERGFRYLKQMARHINAVATLPIRNVGSVAGNLMIKNQHHEFPSDIFLLFEAAGAEIHILSSPKTKMSMTLMDFLKMDMHKKLIYSIYLPPITKEYLYKTCKVMPRAQNAHAIVNSGFLFKLDNNEKVLEKPNIIFGGINPNFLHASKTETFLQGKSVYNIQVLQNALSTLHSELNADYVLPDYKPEFRKLVAVSLFYKFILSINPDKVNPKLKSGATMLSRGLSSGKQDYDIDRTIWPFNMPKTKIGAIHQTSGEAEYIGDIVMKDTQVFCVFTIADAVGVIEKIDSEEALNVNGVVAFYVAKDIPGKNTAIAAENFFFSMISDEKLFAENEITFVGQIYGMIVATSQKIAEYAASKVKIVYPKGPKQKLMITTQDVLASNDKTRVMQLMKIPAREPEGTDIKYEIKGSQMLGTQFHFSMETQTCVCIPIEDGMEVFPSTHWIDLIQNNIATLLGVPVNSINMKLRRLGGSFGSKVTRGILAACGCALACHKLNRPARLVMSIEDTMRSIGKRISTYVEYDVSINEEGKIQKMDLNLWGNSGSSFNESTVMLTGHHYFNCYNEAKWNFTAYDVRTDIPSNCWCRAPASLECVGVIEHIMERIVRVTKKDEIEVRLINMNETDRAVLSEMINELKRTSDYEKRRMDVEQYNAENRWKKRGISLVLMKYVYSPLGQFHSMVSIHARGGTVSIVQGGVEMGQGLHTKIAQIAAHTLGIDLNMISVKPCFSLTNTNDTVTGGSYGSDCCGIATQMACKILLKRLEPIKEMLGGNPPWQLLVLTAHAKSVDLCASYMFSHDDGTLSPYNIYGTAVAEVEVDMLTGQHLIRRADILEDAGISYNPLIDVGQVEGAFVMGLGYWTFEDLIYDPETGNLTNYRTWNYKIPGAKDIPEDFRISFNRRIINPSGLLRSKAVSEPPLCLSCSVPLAIRRALNSARADAGNTDLWYQLDNNLTAEKILLNSLTDVRDMVL